jgi:prepilin-type processing-associated H-X9-DG protein
VTQDELTEAVATISSGDPDMQYPHLHPLTGARLRYATMMVLNFSYSYAYIPWAATSDDTYFAIREARLIHRNQVCKVGTRQVCNYGVDINLTAAPYNLHLQPWTAYNGAHDPDIFAQGSSGGNTLYALKEGIERFFITDINNPAGSAQAQSSLPVYFDGIYAAVNANGTANTNNASVQTSIYNHVPGGCNVLFMDGHVEFLKYPGEFPVTRPVAMMRPGGASIVDIYADYMIGCCNGV